jgi:hypothetical protein
VKVVELQPSALFKSVPHSRLGRSVLNVVPGGHCMVTAVGHVQFSHLHPSSTNSLADQGHVTEYMNDRNHWQIEASSYSSQRE